MQKLVFNSHDVYREKAFLYQYNDNDFRIVLLKNCKGKGFEEIKDKKSFISNDEETQRVSLTRTKSNIRNIVLSNDFTHFATLTINSDFCDRFHLQDCQDKLKYLIKERIRRKNKDFKYLFITEKHKNGAFHFHGLVSNIEFYTNNNGYLSSYVFDELGFNSFSPIVDKTKCSNYILKYITKDCIKNENNQIYISSRGLKKAKKYEIEIPFIEWHFENDFCKISDFSLKDCDKDVLENLLNIKERT